ncbi:MAG: gamma-glutamyltransferase, partial [Woeseiaceae bacterium]|nr:gamma-glutamyltransferase [Woeseiaceae bacterium]
NAVDCGIAASFCSINSQPGVCALAGGAFVTIWHPDESPVTIDGNVAVPGIGSPEVVPDRAESVTLEYGGGITTLVGASSVATPGTLAALYLASKRYGRLPWRELLHPTIRAVRDGFPLPTACHYYLSYAGDVIYGRSADGHCALHDHDGKLVGAGANIVVPHLADSLTAIAEEGDRVFYAGEIARKLVGHVTDNGGRLTMADLGAYTPDVRDALSIDVGDWRFATNPLPAIGGVNLAAMLHCFGTEPINGWTHENLERLVRAQEAVMTCRMQTLDTAEDVGEPAYTMLELARSGELISRYSSGSTVHTSAVDDNGLACAITASSGYGAGEMPAQTGLWLNNCLGELELNRQGLNAGPAGKRLPSNMAPSCARTANKVLAVGSPGADRITTALHQFLVNFLQLDLDLDRAVALPRLHLKIDGTLRDIAIEPGLELPDIAMDVTCYDELSMYFGGVVAALNDNGNFTVAADPRREGGTIVTIQ